MEMAPVPGLIARILDMLAVVPSQYLGIAMVVMVIFMFRAVRFLIRVAMLMAAVLILLLLVSRVLVG
ncbi:MAG: hypothetical protein U9N14_02190 [Pseudomonadota bacterium]|nr:hypothetical protein [Pseudomonadota bacterium]